MIKIGNIIAAVMAVGSLLNGIASVMQVMKKDGQAT